MNKGEPIIKTLYSSISIIKNVKMEILKDNLKDNKRISSIIYFKVQNVQQNNCKKNMIICNKRLIGIVLQIKI